MLDPMNLRTAMLCATLVFASCAGGGTTLGCGGRGCLDLPPPPTPCPVPGLAPDPTLTLISPARGATGVVAVAVSQEQVPDPGRVEAVPPHIVEDRLRPHPGAHVDQRQLGPTVDKVDMAVIGVGEVEPVASRSDQVDTLGQPHGLGAQSKP